MNVNFISSSTLPLACRAIKGPTLYDLVKSLYNLGIMHPIAIAEHLGISYEDAERHVMRVRVDMQRTWIMPIPEGSEELYYRAFTWLHQTHYGMGYICSALKISQLDYLDFLIRYQKETSNGQ